MLCCHSHLKHTLSLRGGGFHLKQSPTYTWRLFPHRFLAHIVRSRGFALGARVAKQRELEDAAGTLLFIARKVRPRHSMTTHPLCPLRPLWLFLVRNNIQRTRLRSENGFRGVFVCELQGYAEVIQLLPAWQPQKMPAGHVLPGRPASYG